MLTELGRNPTKRRGRPPVMSETRDQQARAFRWPRNQLDAHRAVMLNVDRDFARELLQLVDEKKTTMTVVQQVARFPREDQRAAFALLNRLGARAAKRWVECQINPPTREQMAGRLVAWARREFPTATVDDLTAAFRHVARAGELLKLAGEAE